MVSGRVPGGGYELTGLADDARLFDVVEATEVSAENGPCVLRGGLCSGEEPCPIHAVWIEVRQVLIDGFDTIGAFQIKRR